MLKVALINNMNNNLFSLTRYLRDKGIDAHLFQVDILDKEFMPACDTFEDIKNCSYIHFIANISFQKFFSLPFSLKNRMRLKKLKLQLQEFDIIIGCGGLAVLEWAGIYVDIFLPVGFDILIYPFLFDYCRKKFFPYSYLLKKYISYQKQAIQKTRAIIAFATLDEVTENALTRLNEKWIDWTFPMVYPLAQVKSDRWNFLNQHDFIVFSHTRHVWKQKSIEYKGNDKAIRAFARFVKMQKYYHQPIMVLFEKGIDVAASKTLINELGITDYVKWMPHMERKYIYAGLKNASIAFDTFLDYAASTGGVSLEAFSHSIPVIGNSKLQNKKTNLPLIHARTEEEIFNIFMDYGVNPKKYIEYGRLSKQWFDQHIGEGLVNKYIDLIKYLAANKSISIRDAHFNLPTIQSYIYPKN